MSAVPPALDHALGELSTAQSSPENLRLYDALHFLREALRSGESSAAELEVLVRLERSQPSAHAASVLAALGHQEHHAEDDPLVALLEAAGLPTATPEPQAALTEWVVRQRRIVRVQQERLNHAERILGRTQQGTQLGAAIGVVLLGVVVLLLVIEGGWLVLPDPPVPEPTPAVQTPPPAEPERRR